MTRRGQHAAFEVLFSRYQSRLLAFCRHMLSSREDAEDVLQEVFTAAFNAVLADEREINVRPWLYRIARNRSLNHLRRASAIGVDSMDVHYADNGLSTGERVLRRESFRQLLGDVKELPETQRTALLLREIDALSYEQIADAMETTVPSVKSLLVRARISLAEAAEARKLSCEEVRLQLGEVAEGLAKLGAPARRHVRGCERCRSFKKQLKENNHALAAIFPVGPLLLAKKLLLTKLGSTASAGSCRRQRRRDRRSRATCRRRRRRRSERSRRHPHRGRRRGRDQGRRRARRRRDRHGGRRRTRRASRASPSRHPHHDGLRVEARERTDRHALERPAGQLDAARSPPIAAARAWRPSAPAAKTATVAAPVAALNQPAGAPAATAPAGDQAAGDAEAGAGARDRGHDRDDHAADRRHRRTPSRPSPVTPATDPTGGTPSPPADDDHAARRTGAARRNDTAAGRHDTDHSLPSNRDRDASRRRRRSNRPASTTVAASSEQQRPSFVAAAIRGADDVSFGRASPLPGSLAERERLERPFEHARWCRRAAARSPAASGRSASRCAHRRARRSVRAAAGYRGRRPCGPRSARCRRSCTRARC